MAMTMSWFRRKSKNELAPRAGTAGAPPEPVPASCAPEVIRHVPGVWVDVVVKLPDGGTARSTHYARVGSASLGRVRIGSRNLSLGYAVADGGALTVFGEIPAGDGFDAFEGEAPEGDAAKWSVPLPGGNATLKITAHRQDVPA